MKRSIEDVRIEIRQVERRIDFFNHYNMHDDAEAETHKLETLEQELEAVGTKNDERG